MKSILLGFDFITLYINKLVRFLVFLLSLWLACLIMFQILSRFFFGFSIAWMEEVTGYTLAYIAMLGSSCLIRAEAHINLSLIVNKFPKKVKHSIDLVGLAILIYYMSIFITAGYDYALMGAGTSSPSQVIDVFYPRLAIPLGGVFMIIQVINLFLKKLFYAVLQEKDYKTSNIETNDEN